MPVAIRLYRLGKKKKPVYRIIAINKRDKRQGVYLEEIGFYDPIADPSIFSLKQERLDYWLSHGAILSEAMLKLLKQKKAPKKA